MNYREVYNNEFKESEVVNSDFVFVKVSDYSFLGLDTDNNLCYAIISSQPQLKTMNQKTQLLSLEFNVKTIFRNSDAEQTDTLHILKCFSKSENQKQIFLDLCEVMFDKGNYKNDDMFLVFQTLIEFFSTKKELSDIELQGIYSELYLIKYLDEDIDMYKYWQSKDKMKFDFSITDKIKVEVKSTLRESRTHHFMHDQLNNDMYDIIVASIKLRLDDKGYSLFELISDVKRIVSNDLNANIHICKILNNVDESRLRLIKYDEKYLISNLKFYDSKIIPHFHIKNPEGVSKTEYDSCLDNLADIERDVFTKKILMNIS